MADFHTPEPKGGTVSSKRSSNSSTTSSKSSTAKSWHLNRAFYNYSYSPQVPRIDQDRIHSKARLEGHFGRTIGVDFVDNATLLSCAQDSKMIIWDSESCLKRAWVNLSTGSIPTCCSVERSERRLMAWGGYNASIEVFDINKCLKMGKTGLLHENDDFIHHGGVAPHLNPVHSNDDAICSQGHVAAQHEMVLVGHESFLTDLAWCEADRCLISTSGDSSTILWDVEMQTKLLSLGGHSDDINCVALCPQRITAFLLQRGRTADVSYGTLELI